MINVRLLKMSPHDSLEITLNDESNTIDLYYYCLDNSFLNEEQGLAKGLLNFITMIEIWSRKIDLLKINQRDFLPFDYSDEYIGFFIVSRLNEFDISIQAAFTTDFLGWGTNPSQIHSIDFLSKPYRFNGKEHKASLKQFITSLNKSKSSILRDLYRQDLKLK